MKYGLFAAVALAGVAVTGTAFAGVATSGIANQSVAPASSIVEHAGWRSKNACYRHCRRHGHSRTRCHWRCKKWW